MDKGLEFQVNYGLRSYSQAEQMIATLKTAIAMCGAFAQDTERFRTAYAETFSDYEVDAMSRHGISAGKAKELTEQMLGEYFANLQMVLYSVAFELARLIGDEEPDGNQLINKERIVKVMMDDDMSNEEVMAEVDRIFNRNN